MYMYIQSPFELSLEVCPCNFRDLNARCTGPQKQVHSLESDFLHIFLSKIELSELASSQGHVSKIVWPDLET